jgi:glyoxylase-like metal-dependent hydrolase (beta-lactamase superfamily II)
MSTKPLHVEVFVGSPDGLQSTSTLIYGRERAMLVDAQFLRRDARRLAHSIQLKRVRLTTIFITHAHPDQYFGLDVLTAAFPDAEVIAAPEVAHRIAETGEQALAEWKPRLQKHIPDVPPTVRACHEESLSLEGHQMRILHIGQGDTSDSTMLHLPSQHLVIAGDVAAHGTHLWLGETNDAQRRQWERNLDAIRGLEPLMVIPGHKGIDNFPDDTETVLTETQQYLRDFNDAMASAASADDVIQRMQQLHKTREVPWLLEHSAPRAFERHQRDTEAAKTGAITNDAPRRPSMATHTPSRARFRAPRFKE